MNTRPDSMYQPKNFKLIQGVRHVWDIFENAWVTEAYWEFVNGRTQVDPKVRTLDEEG